MSLFEAGIMSLYYGNKTGRMIFGARSLSHTLDHNIPRKKSHFCTKRNWRLIKRFDLA